MLCEEKSPAIPNLNADPDDVPITCWRPLSASGSGAFNYRCYFLWSTHPSVDLPTRGSTLSQFCYYRNSGFRRREASRPSELLPFNVKEAYLWIPGRVISFSLRAVSATEPLSEQSDALLEYMQVTIAMGLVAIAQDLSNLLRCILVNSTFQSCPDSFSHIILPPSDNEQTWRLGLPPSSSLVPSLTGTSPSEPVPDQHRRRFWFRRIHNGMTILYVVSLITGLVGNSRLVSERHDQLKTLDNQILRCGH